MLSGGRPPPPQSMTFGHGGSRPPPLVHGIESWGVRTSPPRVTATEFWRIPTGSFIMQRTARSDDHKRTHTTPSVSQTQPPIRPVPCMLHHPRATRLFLLYSLTIAFTRGACKFSSGSHVSCPSHTLGLQHQAHFMQMQLALHALEAHACSLLARGVVDDVHPGISPSSQAPQWHTHPQIMIDSYLWNCSCPSPSYNLLCSLSLSTS